MSETNIYRIVNSLPGIPDEMKEEICNHRIVTLSVEPYIHNPKILFYLLKFESEDYRFRIINISVDFIQEYPTYHIYGTTVMDGNINVYYGSHAKETIQILKEVIV